MPLLIRTAPIYMLPTVCIDVVVGQFQVKITPDDIFGLETIAVYQVFTFISKLGKWSYRIRESQVQIVFRAETRADKGVSFVDLVDKVFKSHQFLHLQSQTFIS